MIHSLSKLGTFESCAAKYKFQYIDRKPRGAPSGSAQRGIDNHALIEAHFREEGVGLPPELEFYSSWFAHLKTLPGTTPEAKLALASDWSPRNWEDPEIWWRGVLDLLVPPIDGIAYVYDWKTGKIYPDHEQQREIYAIATLCHYPEAFQVNCAHVYVDLHKQETQTYHRDQLSGLQERWGRRFKALEGATEFPHNPQYSCRWCPFSRAVQGPCPF